MFWKVPDEAKVHHSTSLVILDDTGKSESLTTMKGKIEIKRHFSLENSLAFCTHLPEKNWGETRLCPARAGCRGGRQWELLAGPVTLNLKCIPASDWPKLNRCCIHVSLENAHFSDCGVLAYDMLSVWKKWKVASFLDILDFCTYVSICCMCYFILLPTPHRETL